MNYLRKINKILIILFAIILVPALSYGAMQVANNFNPPNLNSGLVGWWTFDGKNLVQNVTDSAGSNNGTLRSFLSTTTIRGPTGQALFFDATNTTGRHVTVKNGFILGGLVNSSASAWIQTSNAGNISGGVSIYAERGSTGNDIWKISAFESGNTNTTSGFVYRDDAGNLTRVNGSISINDGKWHLVTITKAGTAVTVYVDGRVDASGTLTGTNTFTDTVESQIGGDLAAQSTTGFPGSIDDVRVYNRALSAKEVQQLYQTGQSIHPNVSITPPNLQNGLITWWTFDGKNYVSNAVDSSGSGNTGTRVGLTVNDVGAGAIGQAVQIPNSGTNYIIGANTINITSATVSAWVFLTGYPAATKLAQIAGIDQGDSANTFDKNLLINPSGQLCYYVYDGAVNSTVSPGAVSLNQWHMVTATNDGSISRVYIDGAQVATNPSGTSFSGYTAPGFTVNILTNNFSGFTICGVAGTGTANQRLTPGSKVDDARLYNRVLSAQEIQQLYQSSQSLHPNVSITPPNLQRGLVGWWTFDGKNLINNARDSSGAGNNGFLVGYTATTTSTGVVGQALSFNGSSQYVTAGQITALQSATAASISEWVYRSSASQVSGSVGQTGLSGSEAYRFGMELYSDGNIYAVAENLGSNNFAYNTAIVGSIVGWHHLVQVFDGSQSGANRIAVYLDGVRQTVTQTGTIPSSLASAANQPTFTIGQFNNTPTQTFTSGSTDDVRLYNRALSAAEVQQLYLLGK